MAGDVRAGETFTEAGGTHSTGMHSCFIKKLKHLEQATARSDSNEVGIQLTTNQMQISLLVLPEAQDFCL